VYIFDIATRTLQNTIENPNAFGNVDNDRFGKVMSLSNTRLAVGVPAEDETGADNSGKAYLYKV
jgi:hypothetical protein